MKGNMNKIICFLQTIWHTTTHLLSGGNAIIEGHTYKNDGVFIITPEYVASRDQMYLEFLEKELITMANKSGEAERERIVKIIEKNTWSDGVIDMDSGDLIEALSHKE